MVTSPHELASEAGREVLRAAGNAIEAAARLIDYGMDPLTALARARFPLGKTFSDSRDSLKLERDAGRSVLSELTARGHEISPSPAQSPLAGHPGAILVEDDGSFVGAHDPRSDGLALGL